MPFAGISLFIIHQDHIEVLTIAPHGSITRRSGLNRCTHEPSHLPEASKTFSSISESAGAARSFVIEILERWGLGRLSDDVALVATELTTNAIVHAAPSEFTMLLTFRNSVLRVSVFDCGPGLPVKQPRTSSSGGRGLGIVEFLADRAVEESNHGKLVWAEFATSKRRP